VLKTTKKAPLQETIVAKPFVATPPTLAQSHEHGTWRRPCDFSGDEDVNDVKPGWESYFSGDNTLRFDGVALGASRIGCGTQEGGCPYNTMLKYAQVIYRTKNTEMSVSFATQPCFSRRKI
jgi:hypothetical protein